MKYYPIFLNLRGRRCAVVGGGRVAERRVRTLLQAGADVRVISPDVTPGLAQLAAKKRIDFTRRAYRNGALARAKGGAPVLVFAATNDPAAQRVIRRDAEAVGALVNAADDLASSHFLVPASFSQGDLQVAITTSGASPALARAIRLQLRKTFGRDFRGYLRVLRSARKRVLKTIPSQRKRARIYRHLTSGLADLPRATGANRARVRLAKLVRRVREKVAVGT